MRFNQYPGIKTQTLSRIDPWKTQHRSALSQNHQATDVEGHKVSMRAREGQEHRVKMLFAINVLLM